MAPVLSLLRSMAEKGTQRAGDLLLRGAHRGRSVRARRSSSALRRGARPAVRPRPLRRTATVGRRDGARHRRRRPDARRTSPRSTPTSAGRRRWSTRRSPCWSAKGCPSRASTSTSSRRPRTDRERGAPWPQDDGNRRRSVPKPVFTDAEAGAKEFPSSRSRSYNYFDAAQAPRVGLRGRDRRRPARSRAPPDPGLGLRVRQRDSGYPQEWTELKSSNWHAFLDPNEEWEQTIYRNNANTVRQIRRPSPTPRRGDAFAAWNTAWAQDRRAPRVGVGARRARPGHARLHAGPARRADEHDQQRALPSARCTSCASRRTSSSTTSRSPSRSRASTAPPTRRPGRTTRSGRRRARTSRSSPASATGARRSSRPPSCSSRSSASCSAAGSSCRPRRCRATSSPRRSWARASPTSPASSAARGRCSGCWPTTRQHGDARSARCRAGWTVDPGQPARRAAAAADLVAALREGRALRGLAGALAASAYDLLDDLALETPKEVTA